MKVGFVIAASVMLLNGIAAGQGEGTQLGTQVRMLENNLRLTAFVPAKQDCENWGFAAAVQSILEMQNVPLRQEFWVRKLNGTEVCEPALRTPAALAQVVEGDYRLSDIRNVHLKTKLEDTTVDPGELVRSIRENRPFLLIWKRHTFIVIGIKYVETIDSFRIHGYNIIEMRLMDPLAGAEQKPLVFEKKPATLQEVNGIIEIVATNIGG